MAGQLDATQQQLWQARERLKGARRRVVQLEEVLGSWELIARDLDDALAGVDAVASVRSPARTAVAL